MKFVFPLDILVLRDEEFDDEESFYENEDESGVSTYPAINPNRPQVRSESIVGK